MFYPIKKSRFGVGAVDDEGLFVPPDKIHV